MTVQLRKNNLVRQVKDTAVKGVKSTAAVPKRVTSAAKKTTEEYTDLFKSLIELAVHVK